MNASPAWVTRFGFTRMPFGKAIPAADLFSRPSHQEAIARVRFCVQERLLGLIVGEVDPGLHYTLLSSGVSSGPAAPRAVFGPRLFALAEPDAGPPPSVDWTS